MSHKLAYATVLLALLLPACVEETPGLFIVQNSSLDESGCSPNTSSDTTTGRGTLDLTVGRSYTMFPLVENLMQGSGSVSQGGGGSYEGNRVTFDKAIVTFNAPSGFDVSLPSELEIPISGTLEPNSETTVELEVIGQSLGDQLRASGVLAARNSRVSLTVELQFLGVTTSGSDVESNVFSYPLVLCRGCLLEFPLEAVDSSAETLPNCLNVGTTAEDGTVTLDIDTDQLSCFPGQDRPVDCRICRILVAAEGASDAQVNAACEPVP